MDYIELRVDPTPRDPFTEILIGALAELGFESFEETESGFLAYIQEEHYSKGLEKTSWAWQLPNVEIETAAKKIARVNWNEEWEKNFEPILVDDRVYIHAPFHPQKPEIEFALLIEPKMSFGTGHHQTTHMMVQYVLDLELQNKTLLDMGCGTGVLAILAAQRGAIKVEAIDIDEWAVENSLENAARNGVEISAEKGGAERLNGKSFDVILANINKNILLKDMAHYVAALKTKGTIVFSGFYTHDLTDIKEAGNQLGLELENVKERNNWQAAQFVKTGG